MDGDWNVLVKNQFSNGRVIEQKLADGKVYYYKYVLNRAEVLQTTVTLPSGEEKEFFFRNGRLIEQK
jgi:hypothetical protein